MQRRAFLASVSAAVAGLGGCVGAGRYVDHPVGGEASSATPEEAPVTTGVPADRLIEIRHGTFVPRVATVHVGGLVRWANHDERAHEITSARFHDAARAWEFPSALLEPGEAITHTFDEPGVYECYSSTRGRAATCGAVLVGDVELPGSLPCE